MGTEDDLKRLGQTAAALAGMAAGRAKQVAEQLLSRREPEREEATRCGGSFVEDSRHAAAEVVSSLRREASVILRDLEHLEQNLRAREGGSDGATTETTTTATTATTATATTATTATSATKARTGPAKAARKAGASTAAKGAAKKAGKKTAPRAKKTSSGEDATPRKASGRRRRPSEGQA